MSVIKSVNDIHGNGDYLFFNLKIVSSKDTANCESWSNCE